MKIKETMTYDIIFYEKSNGESELFNTLEALRKRASTNKDARIQYNQIALYIQLLQANGTLLPPNVTKHIDDNKSFVLLHSFRKKTQKTPRREIEKAKSERDDYLSRKEQL